MSFGMENVHFHFNPSEHITLSQSEPVSNSTQPTSYVDNTIYEEFVISESDISDEDEFVEKTTESFCGSEPERFDALLHLDLNTTPPSSPIHTGKRLREEDSEECMTPKKMRMDTEQNDIFSESKPYTLNTETPNMYNYASLKETDQQLDIKLNTNQEDKILRDLPNQMDKLELIKNTFYLLDNPDQLQKTKIESSSPTTFEQSDISKNPTEPSNTIAPSVDTKQTPCVCNDLPSQGNGKISTVKDDSDSDEITIEYDET